MNDKVRKIAVMMSLCLLITISGCSRLTGEPVVEAEISTTEQDTSAVSNTTGLLDALFDGVALTEAYAKYGNRNPLMTQHFGADPFALVYDNRVYVYMTGDVLEKTGSGEVKTNSYGTINTIRILSSADLANWTDHGYVKVSGYQGATEWASNSWAPAAAYKEIGGHAKFFLYFANNASGIGVLVADSPTGVFTDPIGEPLVSRSTPNCADITWLFDPAVFVDDDGKAYLYFGGGIPGEEFADPGTARVVELGEDMISLAGDPNKLYAPYLFEDAGINKVNGKYYFSYCTNWDVAASDKVTLGIDNAVIAYMTGDNPMGPFDMQGAILKNPGVFFGCYGTNHHCIFSFQDKWYIAYHTQILEEAMGLNGKGYRNTHIDEVTINDDGVILPIKATKTGVSQVGYLNPYLLNEAETIGGMAGIGTKMSKGENDAELHMTVSDISSGDWIALYGVDFGEKGAQNFTCRVTAPEDGFGAIQLRLDSLDGGVIGYAKVEAGQKRLYSELTIDLLDKVTGIHDLIFIFHGEGYEFDQWQFFE